MDNDSQDSCCFSNEPKKSCCCFASINWKKIFDRSKAIISNPRGVWASIKDEELSTKDLYQQYMLVLFAFPALFGFIKSAIIGYQIPFLGYFRAPFFSSLIHYALQYVMSLVFLYLFAQLYKLLSPKFGGETTLDQAMKLLAFSAVPALLGSVLLIVPDVGSLLSVLASLYSLYLLWQAIPEMSGVLLEKRPAFLITFIVSGALGALIINMIVFSIAPSVGPNLAPPAI